MINQGLNIPASAPRPNRRQFIQQTSALAGALAVQGFPSLQAAEAAATIVVGVIGPGGMGMGHVQELSRADGVAIAYVCDPDENHRNRAATAVETQTGKAPKAVKDMRQVFEDKAVDAVVIATPDHWHTPAALLALDAGKHVYVEKPVSHNVREGRLLVEAAGRANRVVQVGMQSRSSEYVRRAMALLHEGAIGDVLVAKAWNSQLRANIGHAQPSDPPPQLDYDLWVGPAPMVPYQSNLLHSSWRWFAPFGCGDAGNDGVHDLDIARWGLNATTHPNAMTALGGKYFFDDDQQFPDTQYVVFEYDSAGTKKQLIYEHRIWSPYVQEGHENGNAFYGTKGLMILGKGSGWQLYGPRNKLIEEMRGSLNVAPHHRDFLDAIRTGRRSNADAETGHLSAALAHFSNIATRLRRTLRFDPGREVFLDDAEASGMLRRTYREGHWAAPVG
ncbi:MAG: Gfo/Idh/MocA family protein [Verrucomicrobiia bacterium]